MSEEATKETAMKLLVLYFCLMASSIFGRIGETVIQCEARYGTPVKWVTPENIAYFEQGDLRILASFRDGKCVHITFTKAGIANVDESAYIFSEEEINAILKANGGVKGPPFHHTEGETDWRSSDGQITATYSMKRNMLVIQTAAEKRLREVEFSKAHELRPKG
jgi:hypothetical protein